MRGWLRRARQRALRGLAWTALGAMVLLLVALMLLIIVGEVSRYVAYIRWALG